MTQIKPFILLLLVTFLSVSCFEDNDDQVVTTNEVNDFVWSGMNLFYLYKDDVPNLANNRFSNNADYTNYLNNYSNPENLFESLIYQRNTVDRFSWIVNDYIALENLFKGVTTSNGMEYQLNKFSSSTASIFGVVTMVLPNTSADAKGLKRGDIFYAIDDIPLTTTNYSQLLNQDFYTINLGIYDDKNTSDTSDDSIIPTSNSISLTKSQYAENPIYINKTLNVNGNKIGYLMYNGFIGTEQFNSELNGVFSNFKSAGITDLVLDLRYNPGGSVNTAILLSSMITGQFTGKIYSTEQWNTEFQEYFENDDPEFLINRFVDNNNGTPLNSLNLSKVYIITTGRSASASELVINSLNPYIQVVQIGTTTAGKYQASTTLYDSPTYSRANVNPGHTYAMQPLIFKSLNVNGVTDYFDGLMPSIELAEDINNLGVLGDVNEPLLATALSNATGIAKKTISKTKPAEIINHSDGFNPINTGMYTDKALPLDLLK